MSRLSWFLLERGGLLAIATLLVFGWISPPHIIFGDNAEFCGLAATGGVAHPSGYPLYVLWLRAWSWLPVATPAHAAALATVLLTAIEVLVVHAACSAWGARHGAATFATALFVASPIVARVQSTAEVFALNGLLVAAILWLSAEQGPLRGRWRVLALGLLAGLALSNHLTCVFVAPVGLLGAIRGAREEPGSKLVTCGLGVVALVVGLLPYAYLYLAPRSGMSWSEVDDLEGLVHHFLRADYGTGRLSLRGGDIEPMAHLTALTRSIGRAYLWLPALLGFIGLGHACVRGSCSESRSGWIALAAAFLLSGPLFAGMTFNIDPSGVGLYTIQRLHVLAILLLAVPLAVTIGKLFGGGWVPALLRRSRTLQGALLVSMFLAALALSLPAVSRAHSPAAERALGNLLRSLPENAVVIGSTDEFHFGLGYLQFARGVRTDVVPIMLPQMGLFHYRERLRHRLGFAIEGVDAGSGEKLSVKIAEQVLASGRPLFIDAYQANIAAAFPSYPYGLVFRILPLGHTPPPIDELFATNKAVFERYRIDYARPGTDDVLATQYHFLYARVWFMLANGLAQAGRGVDAQIARDIGDSLAPR